MLTSSDILCKMKFRFHNNKLLASALVTVFTSALIQAASLSYTYASERPNIVYILSDTPTGREVGIKPTQSDRATNIESLANSGVTFTRFYSPPGASPSRAAALTGRYPFRLGFQTGSVLPWSTYGLAPDERLLSQALNLAGYKTAFFGSWLLGHSQRSFLPTHRGFDHFRGHLTPLNADIQKLDLRGQKDWFHDERQVDSPEPVPELIGREAALFITKSSPKEPLFLFVSFSSPNLAQTNHDDFDSEALTEKNTDQDNSRADNLSIDHALGQILKALKSSNILENTLIVFQSGNQLGFKELACATASERLELSPGCLKEEYIRPRVIWSWPGKITHGTSPYLVHAVDVYATLLNIAGASTDRQSQVKPLDGVDIWPLLTNRKSEVRQSTIININEFGGGIIHGKWKLVSRGSLPYRVELYDTENDPLAQINVASQYPELTQELTNELIDISWEMVPSLYLEDLMKAKHHRTPLF